MQWCKSIDVDDLLSYQTVKFVKIKDRRLGGIHYFLQFVIAVYIVAYTIVYQQRYLRTETPNGSIRATVQEPPQWVSAETLPYCYQNSTSVNGFENNNCTYLLGLDLTYPPALVDSIFVSTRIKNSFFPRQASNCPGSFPLTTNCAPVVANATWELYYTAGIEEFTLYMEHAIFGRQSDVALSNVDCQGQLLLRNGSSPIIFSNPLRGGDIITMRTVLNAANIPTLDDASGVPGSNRSLRDDGVFIMAVVLYTNEVLHPEKYHYTYQFYQVPEVNVISKEPTVGVEGGFQQRTWYGTRIVFLIGGTVGMFDFPTLLTSLVNGLVLTKLASVMVDMLLVYVMPDKQIYSQHKFEVTEDFTDRRKTAKQRDESTVLNRQEFEDIPNPEP